MAKKYDFSSPLFWTINYGFIIMIIDQLWPYFFFYSSNIFGTELENNRDKKVIETKSGRQISNDSKIILKIIWFT